MSGPQVTQVPGARDGRTIIVKHGDRVTCYTPLEARALKVRLERVLADTIGAASEHEQMDAHQRRHLHAVLREHGATGDGRFPVLAGILGRPIGSTNDLNPDEADRCIAVLRARLPQTRTRVPNDQEPF